MTPSLATQLDVQHCDVHGHLDHVHSILVGFTIHWKHNQKRRQELQRLSGDLQQGWSVVAIFQEQCIQCLTLGGRQRSIEDCLEPEERRTTRSPSFGHLIAAPLAAFPDSSWPNDHSDATVQVAWTALKRGVLSSGEGTGAVTRSTNEDTTTDGVGGAGSSCNSSLNSCPVSLAIPCFGSVLHRCL